MQHLTQIDIYNQSDVTLVPDIGHSVAPGTKTSFSLSYEQVRMIREIQQAYLHSEQCWVVTSYKVTNYCN